MEPSSAELLDITWRSAVLLSVVVAITAVAIALLLRDVETKANIFLGTFMLVFALNLVPQIIGFAGFYQAFPGLTFAPFNNELWLGPLFLFHALALTKQVIYKRFLWLILPGILQTAYYTIAFFSLGDYQQKWAYSNAVHNVYISPIQTLLILALSVYCLYLCFKITKQYEHNLLEVTSNVEPFDTSWLKRFVYIISLLLLCWILFAFTNEFITSLSYISQYPFHVLLSVLVLSLGLSALSHIRIAFPASVAVDDHVDSPNTVPNLNLAIAKGSIPCDSPIKDSEVNERGEKLITLANNIKQQLELQKWYLQSDFSMHEMARQLMTNETYCSRAINTYLSTNFNTLINSYRVTNAKQLMRLNPNNLLADIMYESGFNSKASFNRVFKLHTKLTPSQFLKQIDLS